MTQIIHTNPVICANNEVRDIVQVNQFYNNIVYFIHYITRYMCSRNMAHSRAYMEHKVHIELKISFNVACIIM